MKLTVFIFHISFVFGFGIVAISFLKLFEYTQSKGTLLIGIGALLFMFLNFIIGVKALENNKGN